MVLKKVELPSWVGLVEDQIGAHALTSEGLTGLMQHAAVTNRIGELLARDPSVILPLLEELAGEPDEDVKRRIFWSALWSEILGRRIEVPPFPKLKGRTRRALEGELGPWMYMFLPSGLNVHHIDAFDSGTGRGMSHDQDLPGRWVAVESLPVVMDGSRGYRYEDKTAQAVGFDRSRLSTWDNLQDNVLPRLGRMTSLGPRAVRLPNSLETVFIANLWEWMQKNRGMDHRTAPSMRIMDPEWCAEGSHEGDSAVFCCRPGSVLSGAILRFERERVDEPLYWRAMAFLPKS